MYRTTPHLDSERVSDIVAAIPIPIALHGGTGMQPSQFSDLIGRGCAKVNISTALKMTFMQSGYDYMTSHPGEYDPPSLFRAQRAAVMAMARDHIRMFGSEGKGR
jgi:fructose-bisphosphate aldolase class II